MRFFGALWEPVVIVALTAVAVVVVVVVAGFTLARCDDSLNPCAHRVTGQVYELDPRGRDALVTETWCAEWKPGRAPEGGAP